MPTETLYERTADVYDIRHNSPTTRRVRILEKALIRRYAHGKALDVGCGTGYHLDLIQDIVGLDPSREMLEKAKAKGKKLVLGKGEHLPFKDSEFDTVLCLFSVLNVCDAEKAAQEIRRVLKPGGIAIVSVASVWDHTHMGILRKLRTNPERFRTKNFRVARERAKLRLFTKRDFLGLFSGFELVKFDSLYRMVKPRWNNFSDFSFWEKILLRMERIFPKGYGNMYFGVFRKIPILTRLPNNIPWRSGRTLMR
jgi:ubiquinone/menaquinone biosynthesis C-methylase UbiE